jgi:hypothetical protein
VKQLASTTTSATCESCGSIHDVAVPTPGFFCESCIVVGVDADARRTRNRALAWFAGGAIMIAIAALMWMARVDDDPADLHRYRRSRMPVPVWVGIAGISMCGIGGGMLRFRPRLKLPD